MKQILLSLAIILLGASCSNSSFSDVERENPYDSEMVTFLIDSKTRGTPINTATDLTDIGVFGYYTGQTAWTENDLPNRMFNEKLEHVGSAWIYTNNPIQWNNSSASDLFTFFAYAPYATSDNGIEVKGSASTQGVPSLTYTVPVDVTQQPDLMVAIPRKDMVKPANSSVSLSMKHALTTVGFQVAGNDEKITGISISGVSMTGTLAVDGGAISWTNLDLPVNNVGVDFSASINFDEGRDYYTATSTMSSDLMAGDGYLMMIPQQLGSNALLTVTYKDGTELEVGLDKHEWLPGKKVIYELTIVPGGIIVVEPEIITLPYSVSQSEITVDCSDGKGNALAIDWTLTASQEWLTLSFNSDGSGAARTLAGTGSQKVYVFATENTSTVSQRSAVITLNGDANVVTTVVQLRGGNWGNGHVEQSYVSAFWRANQRAERLITIPFTHSTPDYKGKWTVHVIDYGSFSEGDILFAPWDGTLPAANTNDPDDAGLYVTGNTTFLSGVVTSEIPISFKIGLRNTIGANEHRYARVSLTYGNAAYNYTYIIYLRQGDAPDYLFRNNNDEDAINGVQRTLSKAFSPYNLTAKAFLDPSSDESVEVGAGAGEFVDYPSQAGAFWQWAAISSSNRNTATPYIYAFNPANPYDETNLMEYGKYEDYGFWGGATYLSSAEYKDKTIAELYETCPEGYRRPSDGSTADASPESTLDATTSEINQSLFLNSLNGFNTLGPKEINAVWGYCADGFFDRRARETQNSTSVSSEETAVSINLSTVAYVGMLLYNPNTSASLFLPAAGYRSMRTTNPPVDLGFLSSVGVAAQYWSASSRNNSTGWSIHYARGDIQRRNSARNLGLSLRCVQIDP